MKPLYLAEPPYRAVQGEGPHQGHQVVFVRTQLCSVGCTWCDTKFSWPHLKDNTWEDQAILDAVAKFAPFERIVFTGGEPFQQGEAVARLTGRFLQRGYEVDFETSGTFVPHVDQPLISERHLGDGRRARTPFYVVSPKLSHAKTKIQTNPNAILWFRWQGAHFKFVVATPSDLDEVEAFLTKYCINDDMVWLMPCGTDALMVEAGLRMLHEEVPKRVGLRLARISNRMHVQVFGQERGR